MKADNLSFHLILLAAWRTLEVQRYRASNSAKISNFVRKLLRFGGFFPQFLFPRKNAPKMFCPCDYEFRRTVQNMTLKDCLDLNISLKKNVYQNVRLSVCQNMNHILDQNVTQK